MPAVSLGDDYGRYLASRCACQMLDVLAGAHGDVVWARIQDNTVVPYMNRILSTTVRVGDSPGA